MEKKNQNYFSGGRKKKRDIIPFIGVGHYKLYSSEQKIKD